MEDITQAQLEARLPELSAPEGDTSLYDKVLPYARKAAKGYAAPRVGGADPVTVCAWADTVGELYPFLADFAVFRGVYDALPHLDVIATGTGFGVVNTQNLAPASRERVNAVRESCRALAATAYDHILSAYFAEYPEEARTFVPTVSEARAAGIKADGKDVRGEETESLAPRLAEALADISDHISPAMAARLLKAQYTPDAAEKAALAPAVQTCRQISALWANDPRAARPLLSRLHIRLRVTLDSTPEAYAAEWHASAERRAWHSARYENTQDAPVYFFG